MELDPKTPGGEERLRLLKRKAVGDLADARQLLPKLPHGPQLSALVARLAVGVLVLSKGLVPPLGTLPLNPLVILLGVVIMFYAVFGWQNEVSAGK